MDVQPAVGVAVVAVACERQLDDRALLDRERRALFDVAGALDFVDLAADPCCVVRNRAIDDDAADDAG